MSYTDQIRRPSAGSMAAVIGIHAAIGTALVVGLTVSGTIPQIVNPIEGRNIPVDPPPPPPVEPADPADPVSAAPAQTIVHVPVPPIDFRPIEPQLPTTTLLPRETAVIADIGAGKDLVRPSPGPNFEPVAARPRNDPSHWLTDGDYRSGWARRELTGTARFRLAISADGRVTDCTVTGSTGHPELDTATCVLVARRARFEPARGPDGEPVAGSYSSAVRWELPD